MARHNQMDQLAEHIEVCMPQVMLVPFVPLTVILCSSCNSYMQVGGEAGIPEQEVRESIFR